MKNYISLDQDCKIYHTLPYVLLNDGYFATWANLEEGTVEIAWHFWGAAKCEYYRKRGKQITKTEASKLLAENFDVDWHGQEQGWPEESRPFQVQTYVYGRLYKEDGPGDQGWTGIHGPPESRIGEALKIFDRCKADDNDVRIVDLRDGKIIQCFVGEHKPTPDPPPPKDRFWFTDVFILIGMYIAHLLNWRKRTTAK